MNQNSNPDNLDITQEHWRRVIEIEKKIANYERYKSKNYVNYLDEKYELDKAITKYKEKYDIQDELYQNFETIEYKNDAKEKTIYIYIVNEKIYGSDVKIISSKEILAGFNSSSYRTLSDAQKDCENHGYKKSQKQLEKEKLIEELTRKKSNYLER